MNELRSNFEPGSTRWAVRRAQWLAMGIKEEDFHKPKIAVVNSSSGLSVCYQHLDDISRKVQQAIRDAGGLPFEIRTVAPSDFVTSAGRKARYLMPSRDLLVNDVEVQVEGAELDGMVLLASCDKTTPGQLMAAGRLNIPSIVLACGYQLGGHCGGKDVDIEDLYNGVGTYKSGQISLQDLTDMDGDAALDAADLDDTCLQVDHRLHRIVGFRRGVDAVQRRARADQIERELRPEEDARRSRQRGRHAGELTGDLAKCRGLLGIELMVDEIGAGQVADHQRDAVVTGDNPRHDALRLDDGQPEPAHAGVDVKRRAATPTGAAAEHAFRAPARRIASPHRRSGCFESGRRALMRPARVAKFHRHMAGEAVSRRPNSSSFRRPVWAEEYRDLPAARSPETTRQSRPFCCRAMDVRPRTPEARQMSTTGSDRRPRRPRRRSCHPQKAC